MQPSANATGALYRPHNRVLPRGVVYAPSVVDERGRLRPAAVRPAGGGGVSNGSGGDENAGPEVPDSFDFAVPGAWEPNPMLAATWG